MKTNKNSARLPQIWKNHCEKSCEGLSLLFFILSVLGNLTYGAGVSPPPSLRTLILANGIDPLPLHREKLHNRKSPLANRLAGHHGRGRGDFHTVPALYSAGSTECRRIVSRRLTCRFLVNHRLGISLFHALLFIFFRRDRSCGVRKVIGGFMGWRWRIQWIYLLAMDY